MVPFFFIITFFDAFGKTCSLTVAFLWYSHIYIKNINSLFLFINLIIYILYS